MNCSSKLIIDVWEKGNPTFYSVATLRCRPGYIMRITAEVVGGSDMYSAGADQGTEMSEDECLNQFYKLFIEMVCVEILIRNDSKVFYMMVVGSS